jgi:hypothetical protein
VPGLEYSFDHRFSSLEKTERSATIFPELYRVHGAKLNADMFARSGIFRPGVRSRQ